ncbi:hypothetical protein [Spiroplasma endosymbiont of Ammophila pubescens]|uniref:hypothetical protein n=1 Tax=Spiroplasma endosymbiont of Ammophila pubescens TaxID=3066315 RepID=UPI0032B29110
MNLTSKLWENFKNNNININEKSFKIIPETVWYSKPVFLNKEENKIFFNGGGYGTYFIFYESFIYKPFYYLYKTSMKYEIIK